jgi:hypothetical protein
VSGRFTAVRLGVARAVRLALLTALLSGVLAALNISGAIVHSTRRGWLSCRRLTTARRLGRHLAGRNPTGRTTLLLGENGTVPTAVRSCNGHHQLAVVHLSAPFCWKDICQRPSLACSNTNADMVGMFLALDRNT